ncbi:hypothetical protein GCM10011609_49120 [Lentzea pudingi]|uniref:TaqI-like C-terminal specificity domain-containing protein n=1 Tax=Lentzea pudingi TaxID=1789439 RepID=A0ABQ2I9V6_9PSEU|nr:TaqI-like C-terminal specificity domain-containing protein [Lentzea pudingi]GGN04092.1 hypothetical protein GCM10011609_49120 [Lentzea pudingi]
MIKHLNNNFAPLHDPESGTRVGIGVTTGADSIYVLREGDPELDGIEPDRLLRLATAHDNHAGAFRWSRRCLVNPWRHDGQLIDLAGFPGLEAYLTRHRARLTARHTAKAHPRGWYRTIDKVNHDLVVREKLLVQDLQPSLSPILEEGGYYPHHSLYYIVSDQWDMQVLGGLLLSQVAQMFIEAYSVRMRGGTLRFQSQYLKQIRVPAHSELTDRTKQALREAFLMRDGHAATAAALDAYGLARSDLL